MDHHCSASQLFVDHYCLASQANRKKQSPLQTRGSVDAAFVGIAHLFWIILLPPLFVLGSPSSTLIQMEMTFAAVAAGIYMALGQRSSAVEDGAMNLEDPGAGF
jgi:cytochrome c oxidase assembly factor CtaG